MHPEPGNDTRPSPQRTLRIKRGEGRRVERGHLWVFSNEVDSIDDGPGDEVRVVSAKGKLLGSALLSNSSLIRARIYSRAPEPLTAELLRRRLEQARAFRLRAGWDRPCYRLVHAEGDMLPGLVVDMFGDVAVMQITTAAMDARRAMIVEALRAVLDPKALVERSDLPVRAFERLEERQGIVLGDCSAQVPVDEDGARLWADVLGGQKTGFFLDQVANRRALAPYAEGRRVLDLFCYVGAWSVALAMAGARECVGVDTSDRAVELARHGAESSDVAESCTFRRADAFEVLKEYAAAGEMFDLVVVDPPPLARSARDLPKALAAYKDLNLRAMRLLGPGGILATASCSHHVSEEAFAQMLVMAARDTHSDWRRIVTGGHPPDHPVPLATPEAGYLKFVALERMEK